MATEQDRKGHGDISDSPTTDSAQSDTGSAVEDKVSSSQSEKHGDWPNTIKEKYSGTEVIGRERNVDEKYNFHEALRGTVRKKKQSYRKFIFIGLICFLLLAAVIVIAVTLSQKHEPQSRSVILVGELVILGNWTDELADNSSEEYIKKKSDIEKEIDAALSTGKTASYYQSVEVLNLRPGSIIVDIRIVLIVPSDDVTNNGALVIVSVEDNEKKVEITELIKETITGKVNLELDTDRVKLRVSVTIKETTTSQATTISSITSDKMKTTKAQPSTTATPNTNIKQSTTISPPTSGKISTTTEAQPSTTLVSQGPAEGKNDTVVFGSITLDRNWVSALQNKSSLEYLTIVGEFRNQLVLILNGTVLSDRLVNVEVQSLSPGSIVIKFKFILKDVIVSENVINVGPSIELITMDAIREIIRKSLSRDMPGYNWDSVTLTVNQCGRSKVPLHSNFVQSGTDASPGQWPWQAYIRIIKGWRITVCGGTLINGQWVMTAAHCVNGHPAARIRVILGSHTRNSVEVGERQFTVSRVIVHYNYTRVDGHSIYDIALLQLNEPAGLTDNIQPACLPHEELSEQGVCYITGWGDTDSGSASNILQQIAVSTYRGRHCDSLMKLEDILDNMICASKSSSRFTPACEGDSGGPLVCLNPQGRWNVHGVISFGPETCRAGWLQTGYSVLTSVYHFREWIDEIAVCYFTCGDGTCLYNKDLICDGKNQCDDGSDETIFCAEKPTCDFEYSNICGYSLNETSGGWQRLTILYEQVTDLKLGGKPYDHTTNKTGGSYMHLDEDTSQPAVLRSPVLKNDGQPMCLKLHFYLYLPYLISSGSLQVKTRDQHGNERLHWSVNANFGKRWNLMSVTLPPDSEVFLITGTGTVSVDDVILDIGDCQSISCTNEDQEKCESPGLCFERSLLCDGRIQCQDSNTKDEDPLFCGENVTCAFNDDYLCGYKRENTPVQSWALFNNFPVADHTTKSKEPQQDDRSGPVLGVWFDVQENPTMPSQPRITVPPFTIPTMTCFEFYFTLLELSNSYQSKDEGAIHANLSLISSADNGPQVDLWSRQNNQGPKWRLGQVQLNEGTHNLEFVASLSPRPWQWWRNWQTQVSIDDVRLVPGECRDSVVSCSRDEFRCSNNQCIQVYDVCDGIFSNCLHGEDEFPGCIRDCALRLTGGSPREGQGRLEIYRTGEWRTICDEDWGINNARVACRTLGFSNSTNPYSYYDSEFGEGNANIWGYALCSGDETTFDDCSQISLLLDGSECTHDRDVAISCLGPANFSQTVRINNSNSEPWKGVLEIHYDNLWGAICNSAGWDMTAANIACRMLDYTGAVITTSARELGLRFDLAWLTGVTCLGNETSLHECAHDPWGTSDCSGTEYVWIECVYKTKSEKLNPASPKDIIRLVDGAAKNEGRVEVLVDGRWGTMCDDKFTETEAGVICKTLGYSGKGVIMPVVTPGSGHIVMDELSCGGINASLFDCDYNLGLHDCDHYEDVHIRCEENVPASDASQS